MMHGLRMLCCVRGCVCQEYQQVLDLMRDIILATDVAHHLRIFDSLEEMAHRKLLGSDVPLLRVCLPRLETDI